MWVVECAFGDRPYVVTDSNNPNHIQLRSWDEIWNKENMINIAIKRLPANWEYVAWVDADVTFTRGDWARETVQQLQHYDIVQMFSHAIDLGPEGQPLQIHEGFMFNHIQSSSFETAKPHSQYYYASKTIGQPNKWHPGFAFAARRSAIDAIGTPPEFAILGAGDHHYCHGLIGNISRSLPRGLHKNYYQLLNNMQARMTRHINSNIGYVPGTITHHWHGRKANRFYRERWKILKDNAFDPLRDIYQDSQGLWCLSVDKPLLRDDIRAYFRARNEDGVDL